MIRIAECAGCRDDFYNKGPEPASRCWLASGGKMMTRYRIHYMQVPTAKGAFTRVTKPSCYHQVNASVFYNELPDFVKAHDVNRSRRVTP